MMAKKDFRSKRSALLKYKGRQTEKGKRDTDDVQETLIEVTLQVRQVFDRIVNVPDLAAEIDASSEEMQKVHDQNVAALEAMKSAKTVVTTTQIEIMPTETGMYRLVKR